MDIPIEQLIPNPSQPRTVFNHTELRELADSLRVNGQLQSILVEPFGDKYIIIAGERRYRAAQIAGLQTLRADVRPASDQTDRVILALVENIQRADMLPVEEARAYKTLLDSGLSLNTIAHRTGRSTAHISNRLNLLDLDGEIQDLVNAGTLPVDPRSTAALLSVRDPDVRVRLAQKLSRPGQTIKAVVQACETLNQSLAAAGAARAEIPALHIAALREKTAVAKPPRWDALRAIGNLPLWPAVTEAARATCHSCALREVANDKTCRECPAVEILRRLIRVGQGARDGS